jgi:hypothetical protein
MTSTAARTAPPDRPAPAKASGGDDARAGRLRAANINPRTGLATDYLNHFKARDLAIEAYESADEHIRTEFDNITSAMTSILTAVGTAMREARQDKTRATLAEQATGWVKPLVALAGGLINGGSEADVDYIMTH